LPQKTFEVLLVEDNASDADLINQTLKQHHPDTTIRYAKDGAEALDCLFGTGPYAGRQDPYTPHLILLDLLLPKVSGLEVLRIIKSYVRTRTIPIVIFTESPEERKVIEGYALGANSYVVKPTDPEQYRETVRQIAAYWLAVNRAQDAEGTPENDGNTAR
jgi:two-component system, response regulator